MTAPMLAARESQQASRVLFLFSGALSRRALHESYLRGEAPDSSLRGANHLPGAEFLDAAEAVQALLPDWLSRVLPWQARSLVLLPRVLSYDAVIAQDDLLLGYVVSLLSRLRRRTTRWIGVAINTSVLLRRHAHHPVRLRILKTFWRSFATIMCLSRSQIDDLVYAGVPRSRLVFVPLGVDVDFYAVVAEREHGEFILSVGRDLGRDYQTLLAAARRSNRQFVIVAAHKNISADTELPPNVTVKFNLSLRELRELYARALVVVIPSKPDGAPEGSDCSGQTVMLDAMAACRPVIATDRPWISDYFEAGVDLLTVPPEDPAALAAAIELLEQDAALRQRIARAGRERVRARYTTRCFAKALRECIREIAGSIRA